MGYHWDISGDIYIYIIYIYAYIYIYMYIYIYVYVYVYTVALFGMIETGSNSSFNPMGSVPLRRLIYMSKIV